jgi:hypothetical protein
MTAPPWRGEEHLEEPRMVRPEPAGAASPFDSELFRNLDQNPTQSVGF